MLWLLEMGINITQKCVRIVKRVILPTCKFIDIIVIIVKVTILLLTTGNIAYLFLLYLLVSIWNPRPKSPYFAILTLIAGIEPCTHV